MCLQKWVTSTAVGSNDESVRVLRIERDVIYLSEVKKDIFAPSLAAKTFPSTEAVSFPP